MTIIDGLREFAGQKNLSENIGAKAGEDLLGDFKQQLEWKRLDEDVRDAQALQGNGQTALQQIYESMQGAVPAARISEAFHGTPTPVRGLDASECDAVSVQVLNGCVIKGKEEKDGVYLEIKYDDGRVEAYMANALPQVQEKTPHIVKHAKHTEYQKEQEAPYGFLTGNGKEGEIMYNGVLFRTSASEQTITLVSSSQEEPMCIYLPSGGVLKVCRDDIGSLARAMGMFSPEDQGAIMRAIATDGKMKKDEMELEEEQSGIKLFRKAEEK